MSEQIKRYWIVHDKPQPFVRDGYLYVPPSGGTWKATVPVLPLRGIRPWPSAFEGKPERS